MLEGTNAVESCPVTRGNLTKMTEPAFKAICASKQAQIFQGNSVNKFCQICRGNIFPTGLVFTDDLQGGLEVGKPRPLSKADAGKTETCAICEQHRALIKSHGKRICNGCSQVITMIKNNPRLIIDTFNEYSSTVFPEGGNAVDTSETNNLINALRIENDTLKNAIAKMRDDSSEQRLQDEILGARKELSVKSELIAKLDSDIKNFRRTLDGKDYQVSAVTAENERVKKEVSILNAVNGTGVRVDKGKLVGAFMDLSILALGGKPSGNILDHLMEMRKAAS